MANAVSGSTSSVLRIRRCVAHRAALLQQVHLYTLPSSSQQVYLCSCALLPVFLFPWPHPLYTTASHLHSFPPLTHLSFKIYIRRTLWRSSRCQLLLDAPLGWDAWRTQSPYLCWVRPYFLRLEQRTLLQVHVLLFFFSPCPFFVLHLSPPSPPYRLLIGSQQDSKWWIIIAHDESLAFHRSICC